MFRLVPRILFVPFFVLAGSASGSFGDDDPRKVDSSLTFVADLETIFVNIDNDPLAPGSSRFSRSSIARLATK